MALSQAFREIHDCPRAERDPLRAGSALRKRDYRQQLKIHFQEPPVTHRGASSASDGLSDVGREAPEDTLFAPQSPLSTVAGDSTAPGP